MSAPKTVAETGLTYRYVLWSPTALHTFTNKRAAEKYNKSFPELRFFTADEYADFVASQRPGVSLTRATPKRFSGVTTDYSAFVRALWNMGDAAETATGGQAFYARKRDELLETFVSHL